MFPSPQLRRGSPRDFKFAAILVTYSVQSKMRPEEPMRTPPLEPPLEGAPPKPPLGDACRSARPRTNVTRPLDTLVEEVRSTSMSRRALWSTSSSPRGLQPTSNGPTHVMCVTGNIFYSFIFKLNIIKEREWILAGAQCLLYNIYNRKYI